MLKVTKIDLDNKYNLFDDKIYDRTNPEIPSVCCHKISDIAVLDQKLKLLDLKVVKTHLFNEGRLTDAQVIKILDDCDAVLKKENTLVEIDKKCYVFGDIHGQFYDLISILDQFNLNTDTLVFLGDYVDRGSFSVETYLYLALLKSHYPENLYILRGNHESKQMTEYFTFKAECTYKYSLGIYKRFLESFNCLPYAALIQKAAFCCHGGLSPALKNVYDLKSKKRFSDIQNNGLLCDLVWSDPNPYNFDSPLGDWVFNCNRNCAYFYNYTNVCKFLKENNLKMIIRAHEVQEQGYLLYKEYKGNPSVVTIFSAPKYCDTYKNVGAFIDFDDGIKEIKQFSSVPHPYVINGFIDGINWSMPFISEKVVEFSVSIFKKLWDIEVIAEPEKALTKISIMRAEREQIDELQDSESTCCCSMLGNSDSEELDFTKAKNVDSTNEIYKEKVDDSNITINVSPSLKNDIITDLSQLNIQEALDKNEIEVVVKDCDEEIKLKKDDNNTLKQNQDTNE